MEWIFTTALGYSILSFLWMCLYVYELNSIARHGFKFERLCPYENIMITEM